MVLINFEDYNDIIDQFMLDYSGVYCKGTVSFKTYMRIQLISGFNYCDGKVFEKNSSFYGKCLGVIDESDSESWRGYTQKYPFRAAYCIHCVEIIGALVFFWLFRFLSIYLTHSIGITSVRLIRSITVFLILSFTVIKALYLL